MALDESESEEDDEEEEEEEGTDMESDLEGRKEEGKQNNFVIWFSLEDYCLTVTCMFFSQTFPMKWRGAPRRRCTMTLIM